MGWQTIAIIVLAAVSGVLGVLLWRKLRKPNLRDTTKQLVRDNAALIKEKAQAEIAAAELQAAEDVEAARVETQEVSRGSMADRLRLRGAGRGERDEDS